MTYGLLKSTICIGSMVALHSSVFCLFSLCLHSAGPLLCIPVCPLLVFCVHCPYMSTVHFHTHTHTHTHTSLAHSQCLHSAGPFLCIPVCPLSVYVHCLLSHTHLTHAYHRPCNVGLTVSPVVVTQCVPCRNLCVVCVVSYLYQISKWASCQFTVECCVTWHFSVG